jgi:hypothetical protein
MANPSVIINGVTYASVPEVDIPKSGSGTAKFYYAGDVDLASEHLLTGHSGIGANGTVNGNMTNNGATGGTIGTKAGTYTIPAGYTSGGTVSLTNVTDCVSGNILSGKSILGVSGGLTVPTVSQNSTTKVLSIS